MPICGSPGDEVSPRRSSTSKVATPESREVTFAVWGPILRSDLAGLTDRVCKLLASGRGTRVHCDVGGVEATAVTVEALSRLQLAARRYDCQVRLRNASPDLRNLVAFMGLNDVLPE